MILQMCGEQIVSQMCLKTAQRREWLVFSLIGKLLLTHCVCICDLGAAQDGKDAAGEQGEELGQNILVLSLSSVRENSCWTNTLRDALADNIHSAPTMSMDREERNVLAHDSGIGNLQSVKVPPLLPTQLPALNFLGWDFILLPLSVNAL